MFSHIDAENRPAMVNIADKSPTRRKAEATSRVYLPNEVAALIAGGELMSRKGPVFATAIIAGTMAAKRTHELIPFCHQIPLDGCRIEIHEIDSNCLEIRCAVETTHKTGVEMEALTGASIAALTVYDMCKALSHDITIAETKLICKSGGKSDYQA
jgi:cyclic pyranopterin phosphate synthase